MQFQPETYYSNLHISVGYEKTVNFLAMQRRNLRIAYRLIFFVNFGAYGKTRMRLITTTRDKILK